MQERLEAYDAVASERAKRSGVQLTDRVDRKSFADALVPLYPRLLPDRRLHAIVQEIQGGGEIANKP